MCGTVDRAENKVLAELQGTYLGMISKFFGVRVLGKIEGTFGEFSDG